MHRCTLKEFLDRRVPILLPDHQTAIPRSEIVKRSRGSISIGTDDVGVEQTGINHDTINFNVLTPERIEKAHIYQLRQAPALSFGRTSTQCIRARE